MEGTWVDGSLRGKRDFRVSRGPRWITPTLRVCETSEGVGCLRLKPREGTGAGPVLENPKDSKGNLVSTPPAAWITSVSLSLWSSHPTPVPCK